MDSLWIVILFLFLILNIANVLIHSISIVKGILTCKRRARNKRNIIAFNGHEDLETWPKISIIKPIVADNPKIKGLIETYFQIDYPSFDIHFCFQSPNNSCINFVHQLSQQYPQIKVYVHSDTLPFSFGNRKILNTSRACEVSKGELLWVVDENICAQVTSLKEMVTQFDEKDVGCVHQIPIWKNRDTIEHSVNMAYFSCHHSRFYLFSDAVGILCVSGMSMMLDKEKLNEIGGMRSFERFLSEDYAITLALEHRGYKVKVAPSPAVQDPCVCSISCFIERMVRWTRLRFNIHFTITLLEPFVHPLLYSLASALLLNYLIKFPFIFIFIFYITISFVMDQILANLLIMAFAEHGPMPSIQQRIKAFIILHIFIIPYIFILSILDIKKIGWHNEIYNLTWGTIIVTPDEINSKKSSLLSKRFQRFKDLQSRTE